MKSAILLRIALLLLVVASVAAWAVKSLREPRAADAPAASASSPLLADGVAVVNFHGALRCATCLGIGSLSQSVVAEEFASETEEGRVAWSSIDFDEPANAHFKEDYDLVSSNVVVVRRANGADVGWTRLDDVWTYHGDEPVFREYVRAAIVEALSGR